MDWVNVLPLLTDLAGKLPQCLKYIYIHIYIFHFFQQ